MNECDSIRDAPRDFAAPDWVTGFKSVLRIGQCCHLQQELFQEQGYTFGSSTPSSRPERPWMPRKSPLRLKLPAIISRARALANNGTCETRRSTQTTLPETSCLLELVKMQR